MNTKRKIIIEGVTKEGKKFRPSDWAERVSGNLSTFKNRRVHYSPLLKPSFQNGHKCVVLDPELEHSNKALYDYILHFAEKNNLRICGNEDED